MATELGVGYVSILPEVRGFVPALARAIGNAGTRVGGDVGAQFGEQFTRDALGRLRDSRGRYVAEGKASGEAFGEGASEGAEAEGSGGIGGWLGGIGTTLAGAAALGGAAIGAAIGGAIVVGLNQAIDEEGTIDLLQARLGAGSPLAEDAGRAAGAVYRSGFGESLGDASEAIQALFEGGVLDTGASEADIERLGAKALDLSTIFGVDLAGGVNAVGQMLRTGMADNADEAFDLLTRGVQLGGDKAGDLADTMNEYGTAFRDLGLDGAEAMGLLVQGVEGGARDADVVADSLKEFNIRAKDGSEESIAAFQDLGFNAEQMMAAIAGGGPGAADALDQTLDALRGIEDPAKRNALAVKLFGTQAEDLQDALFALDPSEAVAGLGDVEGALSTAGEEAASGAGAKFEAFKRQALGGLSDFMGRNVLPGLVSVGEGAMALFGSLSETFQTEGLDGVGERVSTWLREEGPGIARRIGEAIYSAGNWLLMNYPIFVEKMVKFWGRVAQWVGDEGVPLLGEKLKIAGPMLWQWIQDAAPAALKKMAGWWGQIAAWVVTEAIPQLVVWGGRMWSALVEWFTTEGGPALVRGLGSFLASAQEWIDTTAIPWLKTNAPIWWDHLRAAAVEKGGELLDWLKTLPGVIGRWVTGVAVPAMKRQAGEWFGQIVTIAGQKGMELIAWALELPGRLTDSFSGIADAIAAPFEAAFDLVKDAWNDTIGGYTFTVPDWVRFIPGAGGIAGESFTIPEFHQGGMVPGRGEMLALLEGGEMVLPRSVVSSLTAHSGSQSRGGDFHVHTQAQTWPETRSEMWWEMRRLGWAS